MQTHTKQHGFTLIEILVVVIIVGILAAIMYPSYQRYVLNARVQNAKADMMQVKSDLEKYYAQNHSFRDGANYPARILANFNNQFFNIGFYTQDETQNVNGQDIDLACAPGSASSDQYCLYAVANAANADENRFLFTDSTGAIQVCEQGGANIVNHQLTDNKLLANCRSD